MPSASRHPLRLGALGACLLLLALPLAGCTTTQEKAAKQQAESKRILEKREQKARRHKEKEKGR